RHSPPSYTPLRRFFSFFFFNDPATTEIYTLSLHDALPILIATCAEGILITKRRDGVPPYGFLTGEIEPGESPADAAVREAKEEADRKSTRLNSSHRTISYAVFCLKKKKKKNQTPIPTNTHQ